MTAASARTAANVVVAAAGVAAACVVLTNAPLRRLASRAIRLWLGASVPAYLAMEIRRGWIASAGRRHQTL